MNDNPILMIAILSPGFIGIATTKLLDGDTTPEPLNQGVLKYFLYAAASLIFTDLCTPHKVLHKLIDRQPLSYMDYIAPMLTAVVISIIWALFAKKLAVHFANEINEAGGRNKIFLDSSMLETFINDNQSHFLEITFSDGRIIRGYVTKTIMHEKSLLVHPEPNWTQDKQHKEYTVRTLVYLDTNTTIREYAFK